MAFGQLIDCMSALPGGIHCPLPANTDRTATGDGHTGGRADAPMDELIDDLIYGGSQLRRSLFARRSSQSEVDAQKGLNREGANH